MDQRFIAPLILGIVLVFGVYRRLRRQGVRLTARIGRRVRQETHLFKRLTGLLQALSGV